MAPSAPRNCRVPFLVLLAIAIVSLVATLRSHAQIPTQREPMGPSARRSGLVISEIMYNPLTNGMANDDSLDYIEIHNSKPWSETISGFFIVGSIEFAFPAKTTLPPGGYLVIARQPEVVQNRYGITNVYGPWIGVARPDGRLPRNGGFIELRNRQGAILVSVSYQDSPPWPIACDGKGHSLSLVRPSFGEGDFRAWGQSDRVGGSPGRADSNTFEPLANIVINEYMCHTDFPFRDAIELYNHSESLVNLSGAYLTDSGESNKFRIPDGTTIQPHGFVYYDDLTLGFQLFAGGETVFLVNASQTRVIDAVEFKGQSNNWSSGRSPDGGPFHYGLSTPTLGGPNAAPMRYSIIINEVMFNSVTGDTNDDYIELYNRGSAPVNVAGWFFQSGITFTFPTNTASTIPPGGYLVVAKSPTNLFALHPHLNTNNTVGPFDGSLANSGEKLALAAADYVNIVENGLPVTVKIAVIVSEVTYSDGGRWPYWTDGEGSSLELIDPESDTRLPSNWGASDIAASTWTAIEYNGPLGEPLSAVTNDSVIVMMEGIGECLVDEVEVRADGGPNLVPNGGFESGLDGWTAQGSHDSSTIENVGFDGTRSVHIRAGSRGDNQSNRLLSSPFAAPIPPGATRVSIRAKAKWLRGNTELLVRLHGSATEAGGRMQVPRRFGTPGLVNSRRVANAGPAVYEVRHSPLLPAANQPVVVTARINDPHGLSSANVRYRIDPGSNYVNALMRDDGVAPDAVVNDGIYAGTIPGQSTSTIVAFYVAATDGFGTTGTFPSDVFPPAGLTRCWPRDAVTRECVVRWGEIQMPGDFATYHLWLTSANSNRWHTRAPMNNVEMDATFVYNNTRVIYNALPLYSGSPWHRTNSTTGPAGVNRVDFEMNFPDDEPLLGERDFILNNPGNPDILTVSDLSALNEQIVYKIFEGMDLPHNHRRYFHFFVNGNQRSTTTQRSGNFIFEDSQQPNGNMQAQWFPYDPLGSLFKIEDWFEFERNGFDISANNDADLTRRSLNGKLAGPAYRYMFRRRSADVGQISADLSPVFDLVDVVSPVEDPDSATVDPFCFGAVADWEQWMRTFAVQRALGNFDAYGWMRGKNLYLYKGEFTPAKVMPWDVDYALGLGRPFDTPLFESNDPRVYAMWNTPEIVRAYWRAFDELVKGPFSISFLEPHIDVRAAVLLANNINIDMSAVANIKTYINQRQAFLQTQLATVAAPFMVQPPPFASTTNELLILFGTAPVEVKYITLNGTPYPVTWTSVSNFTMQIVLDPGTNTLVLGAVNLRGAPIAGMSQTITVEYTGPVIDPKDVLVINEIMYAPSVPGAQFIEIINRTNHSFHLGGWALDGADYVFPYGFVVTNGQIITLVRDIVQFKRAHPGVKISDRFFADLSAQEHILALVKPGFPPEVIDILRYEGVPPWPAATVGASIQLIDAAQDNTRPSNWATNGLVRATPGEVNSVAAPLPPYDPVWLNEIEIDSITGPADNFGERDPWVELYNSGPVSISLDGYYLADNYLPGALLQWRFPAGTSLAPGERRLVWLDGETNETSILYAHTSFRANYSGQLALVRIVNGQPQITDYLTWERLSANMTYGDYPDGQIVFRSRFPDVTPSLPNIRRPLNVLVNEWLAANSFGLRNPVTGFPDDWFELYNAEFFPVDLGGFFLTDDLLVPNKFRVPNNRRYIIPPGGFLLVWADDLANANSATDRDLHVNFRLGASGESIGLFFPDGVTSVDTVTFNLQTSDISEGRYGDGAVNRYFMTRTTPRGPNSITTYNSAPRLPRVANQVVAPGYTLLVPVTATDPDGHTITYSFDAAPPGAFILAGGTFQWSVPPNQPWADHLVTVRATDNGTPPRSATTTFTVTVGSPLGPPPVIYEVASINGMSTFSFTANIGHTYRVFYTDDLTTPNWQQADRDFMAANTTISLTDHVSVPKRFYRVLMLD